MQSKILAKLVAKYPGLSKKFLGLIAAKMASKVTEESGIDDAIAELDNAAISIQDLASEFQKEGDSRVNEAKKKWEKENPKSAKPETDEPDDEEEDEDAAKPASDAGGKKPKKKERIPGYVKVLMEKLDKLEADKTKTSIKSKVTDLLKDETGKPKVPEKFYSKRALPEKEEDLQSFVEEIEADWAEITKDNPVQTDKSGTGHQPKRSEGSTETKADKETVKNIVDTII